MYKAAIRHGDPTTTGGFVVAFSSTIHDGGKKIALSGDEATCGNCKGTFKIFGTGKGMSENGRDVVVDGDLVLCPCEKNRVIIGSTPGVFLEKNDGAVGFAATDRDALSVAAVATVVGGAATVTFSECDSGNASAIAADESGLMSLGDAQLFAYQPESPVTDDALQVAGAEGTPGNNKAQNKQFKSVVRELGLNKSQARLLHEEITGEGLGYHEIMQRGIDMFGAGNG